MDGMKKFVWDYRNNRLGKKPRGERAILWRLERKINYDDWNGLDVRVIARHFNKLKLDPGKYALFDAYFKQYGKTG